MKNGHCFSVPVSPFLVVVVIVVVVEADSICDGCRSDLPGERCCHCSLAVAAHVGAYEGVCLWYRFFFLSFLCSVCLNCNVNETK
jgi:hypothetical protein